MRGIFRRILSGVQAAIVREAAHRRYVRLLKSDDATLRTLGVNRADVRLAFLLNQRPDDCGPSGPDERRRR